MKRIAILLVLLACLLFGCERTNQFSRDAQGMGYTDAESGIYYLALDPEYRALCAGAVVGEYKNGDMVCSFREIPELDSALFLTDADGNVYYAGTQQLSAASWQISALLICEEDMSSFELHRLTQQKNAADLALLRDLWFEGEDAVLPLSVQVKDALSLKWMTDAYPNLLYSISLYCYEQGDVYLYDSFSHRAVAVPDALVPVLLPATKGVE